MSYTPELVSLLYLAGKTGAFTFLVPAGWSIGRILVTNTTGNILTGGLKFGSSAGGADVVVGLVVGANALTRVFDSSLLKSQFSAISDQIVYVDAVGGWNSTNLNVSIQLNRYV